MNEALEHDFSASEKTIQVDGRALHYVELGESGRPVLLFVHGLMGTWRNWLFNLLPFADRFRVIAVDLPGFGDSQMPLGEFSIERYAETLRRLMQELAIERVTLIGNSMGGQIATIFAKQTPELLDRIVLVDPAGFSTSTHLLARLARFSWTINWIFLVAAHFKRAIAFNRWFAAAVTKIVLHRPMRIGGQLMLLLLEGVGKAGFVPALKTITTTPVTHFPGEVTVETAIIWGRDDLLIPKSDAFRFAKMIPQARLELLDDVGHIPMFETPERFNALLEEIVEPAAVADQVA